MSTRMLHHFEPIQGWSNDPNGLCYFKGRYHAFFQHNPFAPVWSTMHWGHLVSDDLVHWQELPIALFPDMPYENDGGCFSGSAVIHDDKMWIFYTTVSKELGQTQSIATSIDGVHFEKYAGNPVIDRFPADGSADFRDPKVNFFDGKWQMVLASTQHGVGKVLRYTSDDLLHWDYAGVLFASTMIGTVTECPDFYPIEDGKFMLTCSYHEDYQPRVVYLTGTFDGEKFTPERFFRPELTHDAYAPQSFVTPDGRRVGIYWIYDFDNCPISTYEKGEYAGAFSITREIFFEHGVPHFYPVKEAQDLLVKSDPRVKYENGVLTVTGGGRVLKYELPNVNSIEILPDTRTVEIFINHGEQVATVYFPD